MHFITRLDGQPAGVVHDALADQRQVPGRLTLGAVDQLDHRRRLFAAQVDPQQAATAHLHQGLLTEDLDLKAGLRPDLGGHLTEPGRGEDTARGAREVTGELGGPHQQLSLRQTDVGGVQSRLLGHQGERRELRLWTVRADPVDVAGQRGTFQHGGGCRLVVDRGLGSHQCQVHLTGHGACEDGGRVPQGRRVGLGTLAATDQDDNRAGPGRQHQGATGLGRETEPSGPRGVQTAGLGQFVPDEDDVANGAGICGHHIADC